MRTHTVNKARKDQGNCCTCGKLIEVGSTYKFVQEYRGTKRSIHAECDFRMSDLSTGRLSEVYAAQESAQDEFETATTDEDLTNALETLRDEVQRLGEEYTDSADAIGEHFDGSERHQELEEKADNLEDWSGQIDDAINDLKDFEDEDPDLDDGETETSEAHDKRYTKWLAVQREQAETIVNECPL